MRLLQYWDEKQIKASAKNSTSNRQRQDLLQSTPEACFMENPARTVPVACLLLGDCFSTKLLMGDIARKDIGLWSSTRWLSGLIVAVQCKWTFLDISVRLQQSFQQQSGKSHALIQWHFQSQEKIMLATWKFKTSSSNDTCITVIIVWFLCCYEIGWVFLLSWLCKFRGRVKIQSSMAIM